MRERNIMSNSTSLLEQEPGADEKTPSEPDEPSTTSDVSRTIATAENHTTKDMLRVLASLRRRFLDTYHNRPGRLWVSVNGIPIASLDICNKNNSLTVTTQVGEPLSFIEVISEQEIRLAMLNVNTGPDNSVERTANVSLSDKRELSVSFVEQDSELSICLGYTDSDIEGWERLASLGIVEPSAVQENT
jgi:hypothetical protein